MSEGLKRVVLIVDDELSTRQLVAHMLRDEPYRLLMAGSGDEALQRVEAELPDTILMDVVMPGGVDGFEVCRRLKASQRTRSVPIVLLTSLDGLDNLTRGLDAGADEFLSKPVQGPELRARVRSMLRIKAQYDELLQSLRLRDDLAHMIVHDMRSPLTALAYTADLMLLTADELSSASRRQVETLREQVDRINAYLTDLLLMAKVEAGKLLVSAARVDLGGLVRRIVDEHRPLAESHEVEVALETREGCGTECEVDPSLTQRMVENLLSNALKFSPPGGRVVVCLGPPANPSSATLRLEVIDEGPGIPSEHREMVFEKYGVIELRQRGASQIGLGLTFCRLVAESHGGRIWVEENHPRGTRLVVEL